MVGEGGFLTLLLLFWNKNMIFFYQVEADLMLNKKNLEPPVE